jgi:putative ABC transport system permease protein
MFKFAFQFIKFDKPKSIGVVLGIVISVFLVGQQTGIFLFLTGTMSALVDNTETDLWVVDNQTRNANALGPIDARIGYQIESLAGVEKAYPVVIVGGLAKFYGGRSAPIQVIGVQPPRFVGGPWRIRQGELTDLLEEGAVSVEYFERRNLNNARVGTQFEINGRRVSAAIETLGVRGFGSTFVFTTIARARELSEMPRTMVSAFLVDIQEGEEAFVLRDRINSLMFGVRAWTKEEFSKATVSTILATSGIAFSIGTLILFAAIAGFFIIGLTMYSAAVDRLRDYGTFKAIGADNFYIRNLILTQALFFSVVGYSLAIVLIEGFRGGIANSGVFFSYSIAIKFGFFFITLLISLGGAFFAMRRIAKVEPASVFKS